MLVFVFSVQFSFTCLKIAGSVLSDTGFNTNRRITTATEMDKKETRNAMHTESSVSTTTSSHKENIARIHQRLLYYCHC